MLSFSLNFPTVSSIIFQYYSWFWIPMLQISEAPGNYWLMSPNHDDSIPYFAITKMTLNGQSFLVFVRLTDMIIEQAKINFGQIQLDSLTMFNFVLALSKKCIRSGEIPSLAMDKNFIVADTRHLKVIFIHFVLIRFFLQLNIRN